MLSKYSEEHLGFEVYSRTESRRRNDFNRGGKHIDLNGISVMNLHSANIIYIYRHILQLAKIAAHYVLHFANVCPLTR